DPAGRVSFVLKNQNFDRDYFYFNGAPLGEYFEGTTYFAHTDHLGSTRLLTRLDKTVRECDDYYAFGESINCGDTTANPQKFTGQEFDTESSLTHFWFRQLSSALGRWITPD